MKPEDLIERIKELLINQNSQFDGNIYSFRYTGNIKTVDESYKLNTNPSISVCGRETIDNYYSLFQNLKDCLCKEKRLSLNAFMDATQNLLFENRFNVDEIKKIIDSIVEKSVVNVRKIYGLTTEKSDFELGPFVIVKKDGLEKYIEKCDFGLEADWLKKEFVGKIRRDSKSEENFVYVLYKHNSFDNLLSEIDFAQKIDEFEKVVRFIIAIKHERVFVSHKPFITYTDDVFQIVDENRLSFNSHIYRKDVPIHIDDPYFTNDELGHDKIWEIVSLSNKTDMQSRIFNAIMWLGESMIEEENNKTVAEIAFAFETLLYGGSEIFASKGVVSSLAEAYAFIAGTNPEERINLEKEFRQFYRKRSTISHGTRIESFEDEEIKHFYRMIYKTICRLLTVEEFSKCKSSKDLYEVIQLMRYR